VGFRPFICRLAARHCLLGEVDNRNDGVSVIVQGDLRTIDRFSNEILKNAPPASHIKSIEVNPRLIGEYNNFSIAGSRTVNNQVTEISPDIAVCQDCLADIASDPGRLDYPFVNCTNCGPRFSIIDGLPYDRSQTSMKGFAMCSDCSGEYHDILDRRFHAQPTACNDCGPHYTYRDEHQTISGFGEILREVSGQILSGKTVALKGLGGYFLICDALQDEAVLRLRERKHRDQKPFAVMFRDAAAVSEYCFADKTEMKELISWRRPVVILKQKKQLAPSVSNGLGTTGALLPYMPVHHLLFRLLKTPALVMTSGNISEEPIIIDDCLAEKRLSSVADSIISYNRDIYNRVDDSVVRVINDRISLIRRSRGFVPRPVDLKITVEGILALGAEEKNTFCIGKDTNAVMSQYIGDLKNQGAWEFFTDSIQRFGSLFRFIPEFVACDLHPDYFTTDYALELEKQLQVPVTGVQHHHAHIASCMAEHGLDEKVIGVSLDGTGYGTDGRIWGGEFFVAGLDDFIRVTHFDYIPMPGGDRAVHEPWRMAYSCLFKYFGDSFDYSTIPAFTDRDHDHVSMIREMIVNKINSPESSGAGRLFDAVSALLGLCSIASFDSEAPMRLESVADCRTDSYYPFRIEDTVIFADTFSALIEDRRKQKISVISAKFHNTIAHIILEAAERIRAEYCLNKVMLSGGVFQNKFLVEKATRLLNDRKFEVFMNQMVPSNDGGISLGQLAVAAKRREICA
jgi:hydrogenase maturation protein HypF